MYTAMARVVWEELPLLDLVIVVLTLITVLLTLYTSNLFRRHYPTSETQSRRHQEMLQALGSCCK